MVAAVTTTETTATCTLVKPPDFKAALSAEATSVGTGLKMITVFVPFASSRVD
jgi:hypothetical protein